MSSDVSCDKINARLDYDKKHAIKEVSVPDQIEPLAVQVIYVVPEDAEPWREADRHASQCLEDLQWFFADEMERFGYGPKTFEIAADARGSRVFHQISSNLGKTEFCNNRVKNCERTAQKHGLSIGHNIALYFHESYTITDGKVSDSGKGAKGRPGKSWLSSLHLKMAIREWISNDDGYAGEVFDWISQEAMQEGALSWNKRGRTLGDVSGSAFGIIAHELGHAFGLGHDCTDKNRKGNLMGYGCRGMRGYFRPDLTDDSCRLSKQHAAYLNSSPFFAVRKLKPKSIAFSGRSGK